MCRNVYRGRNNLLDDREQRCYKPVVNDPFFLLLLFLNDNTGDILLYVYLTRCSNYNRCESRSCETEIEIMRKLCTNDSSNVSARAQCRHALCILHIYIYRLIRVVLLLIVSPCVFTSRLSSKSKETDVYSLMRSAAVSKFHATFFLLVFLLRGRVAKLVIWKTETNRRVIACSTRENRLVYKIKSLRRFIISIFMYLSH